MRNFNFGIEIELTGITRKTAAEIISKKYGTRTAYAGTVYQTYTATDNKGRTWKAMRDSSIHTERVIGGRAQLADDNYSTEIVSPILQYNDIDDLQDIVRRLRRRAGFVNTSRGLHIHVGAETFTATHLRNIVNIISAKEDILYTALRVGTRPREILQKSRYRDGSKAKHREARDRGAPSRYLVQPVDRQPQQALQQQQISRAKPALLLHYRHSRIPPFQWHTTRRRDKKHTILPSRSRAGNHAEQILRKKNRDRQPKIHHARLASAPRTKRRRIQNLPPPHDKAPNRQRSMAARSISGPRSAGRRRPAFPRPKTKNYK